MRTSDGMICAPEFDQGTALGGPILVQYETASQTHVFAGISAPLGENKFASGLQPVLDDAHFLRYKSSNLDTESPIQCMPTQKEVQL